jgi:hypothetical protein
VLTAPLKPCPSESNAKSNRKRTDAMAFPSQCQLPVEELSK